MDGVISTNTSKSKLGPVCKWCMVSEKVAQTLTNTEGYCPHGKHEWIED